MTLFCVFVIKTENQVLGKRSSQLKVQNQNGSNSSSKGNKIAAAAHLAKASRRKTIIKCCGTVKCQDSFTKLETKM
jgi:hypothetical protein